MKEYPEMRLRQQIEENRDKIQEIAERNGVSRIRFFGSYVSGEATDESDVDVLVVLEEGRDLLDLVGLKLDLETLMGRKVDVVEEGGLSPYLRDQILAQAREI